MQFQSQKLQRTSPKSTRRLQEALSRRPRPTVCRLGDRACLALAIARKAEVYTTERIWKNLKLGIRIHVLR